MPSLQSKKLKGFALFYAIVIALIVMIICTFFILLSLLNNSEFANIKISNRLITNASSGFNVLLADTSSRFESGKVIDLYGDNQDSVYLEKKMWGLYEIGISKAFSKKKNFTKIGLIGERSQLINKTALYLSDKNKPLALSGNTKIIGDCFLPQAGVKRTYIEGKSFKGDKLIDGTVMKSNSSLPRLNENIISHNLQFLTMNIDQLDIEYQNWATIPDSIFNSFTSAALIYFSETNIPIALNKISGNIIVISYEKVFIEAEAQLEDILVYAPAIEIEQGFKGTLQLFATDSIKILEKCTLNYPSTVCLIDDVETLNKPYGLIKKDCKIMGSIVVTESEGSINQSSFVIESSTIVLGQVYVNGNLFLKGNVTGNVSCKQFVLQTASSIYENHLVDVTIDNKSLPDYFLGNIMLSGYFKNGIAKQLF